MKKMAAGLLDECEVRIALRVDFEQDPRFGVGTGVGTDRRRRPSTAVVAGEHHVARDDGIGDMRVASAVERNLYTGLEPRLRRRFQFRRCSWRMSFQRLIAAQTGSYT